MLVSPDPLASPRSFLILTAFAVECLALELAHMCSNAELQRVDHHAVDLVFSFLAACSALAVACPSAVDSRVPNLNFGARWQPPLLTVMVGVSRSSA